MANHNWGGAVQSTRDRFYLNLALQADRELSHTLITVALTRPAFADFLRKSPHTIAFLRNNCNSLRNTHTDRVT